MSKTILKKTFATTIITILTLSILLAAIPIMQVSADVAGTIDIEFDWYTIGDEVIVTVVDPDLSVLLSVEDEIPDPEIGDGSTKLFTVEHTGISAVHVEDDEGNVYSVGSYNPDTGDITLLIAPPLEELVEAINSDNYEGESTWTTGDGAPTAVTVTAPTFTANFYAALYESDGTTELISATESVGNEFDELDTVVLTYGFSTDTEYVVKITLADETGDYVLSDDGAPAGAGAPITTIVVPITVTNPSHATRLRIVTLTESTAGDIIVSGLIDSVNIVMIVVANVFFNMVFDILLFLFLIFTLDSCDIFGLKGFPWTV
ncbi:hypothetical protein ES703_106248 [subsurface metagenome]